MMFDETIGVFVLIKLGYINHDLINLFKMTLPLVFNQINGQFVQPQFFWFNYVIPCGNESLIK
jgi:hypothetical protein